jgi:hypothetical protein
VAASGQVESLETYFPPMLKFFSISAFSMQKGQFGTVFKDITERKQMEQLLLKSRDWSRHSPTHYPAPRRRSLGGGQGWQRCHVLLYLKLSSRKLKEKLDKSGNYLLRFSYPAPRWDF